MTVTSYDKITVKAIAESAGVSRAAFYLQMTAETAWLPETRGHAR